MKVKRTFYMIVGIVGLVLMLASIVLDGRVPDALDGTVMGVDAPLWVTLACVGVFLGKTILELWLTARYQKTM